MTYTRSHCGCSKLNKPLVADNVHCNNSYSEPYWLAEQSFDAASSSVRKQRARLEKQRKRRLASQQRRKRRKSPLTGRQLAAAQTFLLARPYATKAEMIQAIRQLETGTKSSLSGIPLPPTHRLSDLQKRGLMENVRLVLVKANERLREGASPQTVLKTLKIQRQNPRFRFIYQISSANAALQKAMMSLKEQANKQLNSYDSFDRETDFDSDINSMTDFEL